jgi:hypothetical protein
MSGNEDADDEEAAAAGAGTGAGINAEALLRRAADVKNAALRLAAAAAAPT